MLVYLDDVRAVGGIGKFQTKHFGIVARLLNAVGRRFISRLGLDNS